MKGLLIAEKPSLMRSIRDVYNKEKPIKDHLDFTCFRGHLMRLVDPGEYNPEYEKWKKEDLPIIPDVFKYKPSNNAKKMVKEINNKIKNGKYDYIINACDAAREGELIFHSFYQSFNHKLPVKRFWASDTTAETIKKALKNLINESDKDIQNLKISSEYRAQMDWLYGMNFSRALTLASGITIPAGRVMTPTLNMIVNRENEIKNFVPENYYEVICSVEKDKTNFPAIYLLPPDYKDTKFNNKKKAEKIKCNIGKKAKVKKIKEKKQTIKAPTLYSLLELQKDANKYYGYKASKTLEIAQVLYESKKLITYPRTESRHLPKAMVSEIPHHIAAVKDVEPLKKHIKTIDKAKLKKVLTSKRYVNDSKVTDHHAILPTKNAPSINTLTKEEKNIYLLIAKRLISIFLKPYIVLKTDVFLATKVGYLKASGKVEKQAGFTDLYEKNSKDIILPSLKEGEILEIKKSKILSKKTTPPSRYNDRTILDAMQNAGKLVSAKEQREILKESAGLGTSATRASILDKLEKRKWIKRKGKSFYATNEGIKVIDTIGDRDIISPSLTAVWEKKLMEIEEDKFNGDFKKELGDYIEKEIDSIFKNTKVIKETREKKLIGKCPLCKEDVYVGKKYFICNNYKDKCKFILPKKTLGINISEKEATILLKGEYLKNKTLTFKNGSKAKKNVYLKDGRVTYEKEKVDSEKIGKCPKCGKNLLKSSKAYYCESCSDFIPTSYGDKEIAHEDAKILLSGDVAELKDEKGNNLYLIKLKDKLTYVNEYMTNKEKENAEVVGKCPKCSSEVVEGSDFYICKDYPKKCDFSMKKKIKESPITNEDMKAILSGEKTSIHKFKWKNNKWGEAKLYYENGKLKFEFKQ